MHQIIQEYLLDRVNRKLHMSKVKHTKFNESGKKIYFLIYLSFGNLFTVAAPLAYSSVPNRRVRRNRRAGGKILRKH